MLKATYTDDREMRSLIFNYLQGHENMKDFRFEEEINPSYGIIKITKEVYSDGEFRLCYTLYIEDGVPVLYEQDLTYGEGNLFDFETLKVLEAHTSDDTSIYRPQILSDLNQIMTTLKEVRLNLQDSEDPQHMWYGFGGDPYHQEVLDKCVTPFIPEGMIFNPPFEDYDHETTYLSLPGKIDIMLSHSLRPSGEAYAKLHADFKSCVGIRNLIKDTRKSVDFMELMDRTAQDRYDMYIKLFNTGEKL